MARYIRRSACAIRLAASSPSVGNSATPTLARSGPTFSMVSQGSASRCTSSRPLACATSRLLDALEQDHELVATPAGHRVGCAHRTGQPLGDDHQHPVADLVPVPIVDRLEVVEVDEQECAATAAAAAAGHRMGEPLLEQPAVGETGQPVMGREVEELPRAFVQQGELLEQADHLVPGSTPRRARKGHQPPTAVPAGAIGNRHDRHAGRCRLQTDQRAEIGKFRRSDGEEHDARPIDCSRISAASTEGRADHAGARQARLVEHLLHLTCQLTLTADGQNGETLARRQGRQTGELRPQQVGQLHRHGGFRCLRA